jgi:hypothetical protein
MNDTIWWVLAGAAALIAVASGVADHRRTRRRDLDRPGWVPWALLQILAAIAAVLAIVLALKG